MLCGFTTSCSFLMSVPLGAETVGTWGLSPPLFSSLVEGKWVWGGGRKQHEKKETDSVSRKEKKDKTHLVRKQSQAGETAKWEVKQRGKWREKHGVWGTGNIAGNSKRIHYNFTTKSSTFLFF